MSAGLLLDTHALLWWLDGDQRMSLAARNAVLEGRTEVWVSAASVWEIVTKARIGKLPGALDVAKNVEACARSQGFVGLPITLAHAQRAGALPGEHRDPFDRMLIAQALEEDLVLVSNEALFDAFGVRRLW